MFGQMRNVKFILFMFIFILSISDDYYCSLLDIKHKLEKLPLKASTTTTMPTLHRKNSSVEINPANSTNTVEDSGKLSGWDAWENVTLRIGFANQPFGYTLRGVQTAQKRILNAGSKVQAANGLERSGRTKRGVVQLYNMVNCATGCDPLIYKGYGCYCGFLGSGYPVDGIDRCCKMHDICYDASNCPTYLEYVVPYYWKCYRGKSLCAIDHLELGGSGSCSQRLCECDRLLSECLSRFPCPERRAKCVSSPWRLLQNTLMFF